MKRFAGGDCALVATGALLKTLRLTPFGLSLSLKQSYSCADR